MGDINILGILIFYTFILIMTGLVSVHYRRKYEESRINPYNKQKEIHVKIIAEKESTHTSFYFKNATLGQLSLINSEIDILKQEIISRIKNAPNDYEIEEYGE